jgi:hypothetical protein
MQWQLLDSPQDGTLVLVWHPLEYMGTNFASDGYIWADVEVSFKSEIRGYVRHYSLFAVRNLLTCDY